MPVDASQRRPRGTRSDCPVDVFEYLDIRAFLADVYDAKKKEGRGFSYRAFSRRAGLRSPNHLKRVIDGERPLTAPMAIRYADALGLDGDARAYFIDLAAFSRADTVDERRAAYQRMTSYRQIRRAHRVELAQAAYHSRWYIPAIRELAASPGFREDPAWIARTLVPAITRRDAAEALDILERLGMLTRNDEGALVPGTTLVTTGPETRGMHIAIYHRAMMERAAEAIDLIPRDQRDISSLTFACSDEDLARVKARIVTFRQELIAMLADAKDADRVVQLNLQLFPLTRSRSDA